MTTLKEYDNFIDNEFSAARWSAPTLEDPNDIKMELDSYNLVGRKIKYIELIGMDYAHRRDDIEDLAYNTLESLFTYEEELQRQSDYNMIPQDLKFDRMVCIDEPMIIGFDDCDTFEIVSKQAPEFRMSMNRIPGYLQYEINEPNVDPNVMFSICRGQDIRSVELNTETTNINPFWHEPYDDGQNRTFVKEIILRLESGFALVISWFLDFCLVSCIDEKNEPAQIDFESMEKGLYNWEDIHTDVSTGFISNTSTFFFGERGRKRVEVEYLTLSTERSQNALYIWWEDFLPIDYSIIIHTNDWFDIYGEYSFDKQEWDKILETSEKLLSFDTYEELRSYLIGLEIRDGRGKNSTNILEWRFNNDGRRFWNMRGVFTNQLEDMREWSGLVMSEDGHMEIRGF